MSRNTLFSTEHDGKKVKHFAIATETTDDIVKGRKYELVESESIGYYIIDESGEEAYYHRSSLNV